MKNYFFLTVTLIFSVAQLTMAQNVGIGTTSPDASAKLDITATDKGILVPRMTMVQRNAIASPATGLLIFQTDNTAGFYYYNGSVWTMIAGSNAKSMLKRNMV